MKPDARLQMSAAIETSSLLVGALFLVMGVDVLTHARLNGWGILPRTLHGLFGILFSPLLHASLAHLVANALPLWVLLILLFSHRQYQPARALTLIWLASGLGTWVIGRGGYIHIGASSIIYGLVAYLITAGFRQSSWQSALIAILVFVGYGGIFYGALPQPGPISWEGHLCGALAGVWAATRIH